MYLTTTCGIDIKSSKSASKDAFWSTVLRWRKAKVVLALPARKYSVKPPQPGRWQSHNSYISQGFTLLFFILDIFIASHEPNHFTDWAIRVHFPSSFSSITIKQNVPRESAVYTDLKTLRQYLCPITEKIKHNIFKSYYISWCLHNSKVKKFTPVGCRVELYLAHLLSTDLMS